MIPAIGEMVLRAFVSLASMQGASAIIAVVGTVSLARSLSPEVYGLYAVVSFVLGVITLCSDFGMHYCLIRWPEQIGRNVIDTAFALRVGLLGVLALLVLVVIGPVASVWYESADLYWLLVFAVIAASVSGVFRTSQTLLEREMEYPKLAVIELTGVLAFYLAALLMASWGFGVYSLVAGEVCRALTASLAFVARPFRPALRIDRDTAKAILRFGLSYQAMMLTWMLASGVNSIIVAKIVGFKAAGIIRIAEAITGQLTMLKGITDRVSYPALSMRQENRESLVAAVRVGRLWQCVGVIPFFAFTALGFWLVPLIYGWHWREAANVLPLFCLTIAVNTLFALHSPALITIGRNWEVAKFHAVYAMLVWSLAPICVYYFGYLGLPLAILLATPAYKLIRDAFTVHFGVLTHREPVVLLLAGWLVTVIAWLVGNVALSAVIFVVGHLSIAALIPGVRRGAVRLAILVGGTIEERWQVSGPPH